MNWFKNLVAGRDLAELEGRAENRRQDAAYYLKERDKWMDKARETQMALNVVKDELVESRQATFDALKARTDDRKDLSGVKKKLASTEKALTEAQGLLDATLQREGELDARVAELEAKLEGATRNDTRDPVTGRYVGLRNRGKPKS